MTRVVFDKTKSRKWHTHRSAV